MNFKELVIQRQSLRKYTDQKVEPEKLQLCLEAARLAPSASNSQPWTFIVVDQAELLEKIASASKGPLGTFNKFVSEAPMILVIVMEKPKMLTEMGGRLKKKEYPLIDIGIAANQFCLQAAELGLGTCMLGWFDEAEVKALLGIPEEKNVGLLITVGYAPADYPLRKKVRKSAEIVYRQNGYNQKP